jgi:hypothetical protein
MSQLATRVAVHRRLGFAALDRLPSAIPGTSRYSGNECQLFTVVLVCTTYIECVVPIIEFQPVHLVCQVRSYSLLLIDTTFYDFERLNVGVRRSSMSGSADNLELTSVLSA